jgi:hypothetical protein
VLTSPPPIPADQSELTPGWLTQVLRRAGAIKASGMGRELGPEGLATFQQLKSIFLPLFG